MNLTYISENIKKNRTLRNVKQIDLAKVLNISQSHLSLIESGEKRPSLTLVLKISEALNIDPGELVSKDKNYTALKKIISNSELDKAISILTKLAGTPEATPLVTSI